MLENFTKKILYGFFGLRLLSPHFLSVELVCYAYARVFAKIDFWQIFSCRVFSNCIIDFYSGKYKWPVTLSSHGKCLRKNAVSLFLLVEVQCPEVSYLMTLTSSYFHCSCLGGHFSLKLISWPFRDNLWSVVVDEQDKCVLKHSLLFR